jgi:hypothetical protein
MSHTLQRTSPWPPAPPQVRASAVPLSLDLSCEELVFSLPLDSWQDCAERRLAATNPHPFPVPFRWQAPASGEYEVAPVSGVLQPRKSADFTITWAPALAGSGCFYAAMHDRQLSRVCMHGLVQYWL